MLDFWLLFMESFHVTILPTWQVSNKTEGNRKNIQDWKCVTKGRHLGYNANVASMRLLRFSAVTISCICLLLVSGRIVIVQLWTFCNTSYLFFVNFSGGAVIGGQGWANLNFQLGSVKSRYPHRAEVLRERKRTTSAAVAQWSVVKPNKGHVFEANRRNRPNRKK